MFESLLSAFREAVKNFKDELHRDDVPEAVDSLLRGMRVEASEARSRLHGLEDGIRRARAEAAREAGEVETCQRRAKMARAIGDEETARIAAEYATRHERRKQVLELKASALEQEMELLRTDSEEMLVKIRAAEKQRDGLAATFGRAQARDSLGASEDLFDELDRMAERISGIDERDRAAEGLLDELNRELAREGNDSPEVRSSSTDELDLRLAELKRRMGRE